MAKKRLLASVPAPSERALPLGPGLHGAFVELRSGDSYQIRTTDGRRLFAALSEGVEAALIDDCLRTASMVIVTETARGPEIAGALMRALPAARSEDGVVTLEGKEVRLRGERSLSVEVGPVSLLADESGTMRIEGDRLVIDMAALVRIFSTRVELP